MIGEIKAMLIKRHLMLFFRDKANVFFSLLVVLIIIGLYIMFLGDIMEAALSATLGFYSEGTGIAISSLMLSGMIAVTSVTSCMGAIAISIADKELALKDFLTSPIPRAKITFSYIIGSSGVGLVMTFAAISTCLLYIVARGGSLPSAGDFVLLAITSLLSVACANAMVYFLASFAESRNAFSAISSVIATLIGFLMGVYIPMGQLPESVQWIIRIFPMSHAASMYRKILADGELYYLFTEAGAPPEVLQGFREFFGVSFNYGNFENSFWLSALWLATSTLIFFGLSMISSARQKT